MFFYINKASLSATHRRPHVVFGCLHQVMSGGVPAEGASSLWNPQIFGGGSLVDDVGEGTDANSPPQFSTVIFHCGCAERGRKKMD
jgi:hypothetical protein